MSSAIVVGAGVFGAALADRLAGDGWDVTLVEAGEPGHPLATSGGESRLLRFSHGADAWYARSAVRARELWLELERDAGEELLVQSGLAWFARSPGGWEAESEATLRAAGVRVERLDPEEARRLYPDLGVDDLAYVLLESDAGVLRAARATRALAERAVARGARLVRAHATPAPDGSVALGDPGAVAAAARAPRAGRDARALGARRLEADRIVWACGPWLAKLFPDLLDLRVTRQELVFLAAGPEWAPPRVPAWVDYDGSFYGLGPLDGHGAKVAPDAEGAPADPDSDDREPTAAAAAAARDYAARRFPALAGARVTGAKVCLYELTADTHFVCAPHPEQPHVWLLGGGSGHGFKHGPALAEHVAALLTGGGEPDPRHALGPRSRDRSLRTAGLRATPR